VPALHSYDYAVLRVEPCAERGEFVNAGVILHCPERGFLGARVHLDQARVRSLWPAVELEPIRRHLEAFPRLCDGAPDAGPVAGLCRRERFHWLVAPRNTVIQVSPVHTGLCESPESTLEDLFRRLVLMDPAEPR
jgi:hypothetical protein